MHDYNLALTKAELLDLDNLGTAWQDLSALIEKEAAKLGKMQGGQSSSME